MGEIAVKLGRFGSGKTEFALNYAIKAADSGKKTVLADLDLVNPYFTSGLQAGLMERHNVKLIASIPTDEKVELPEDIYSVFSEDWDVSVLDAGGDPVGARVLGSLLAQFEEARERTKAYYIVNTRRPMSSSVDDICEGISRIEAAARIRVSGLVNNTNLGVETDYSLLEEGGEILEQVSAITGIPFVYTMATEGVLGRAGAAVSGKAGKAFLIGRLNRPEWVDQTARAARWSKNQLKKEGI